MSLLGQCPKILGGTSLDREGKVKAWKASVSVVRFCLHGEVGVSPSSSQRVLYDIQFDIAQRQMEDKIERAFDLSVMDLDTFYTHAERYL